MAESLPSKKISVVDIPEVNDFRVNFVYNFFTTDERTNAMGSAPTRFLTRPSEFFTSDFIESLDFNRFVPRYNEFFWRPVVVTNRTSNTANGVSFQRNYIADAISIRENVNKIYYEDDFSFKDYTTLHYQDVDVNTTLRFIVEKAYQNMIGASSTTSPQVRASNLNLVTSNRVSSNLLTTAINSLSSLNVHFFGTVGSRKQEIINEKLRQLGNVRSTIQVNNKLIYDLVSAATFEDNINPLTNEIKAGLDRAQQIQSTAQRLRDSNLIVAEEYDLEINNPYTTFAVDTTGYDSILKTIGYIIEKYEVNPDGTIDKLEPIFIENPNIQTTVDMQIKYGAKYFYKIRTVAYLEIQAYSLTTNKIMVVGFLVASKPVRSLDVACQENLPPPPPSDFNITWDYTRELPRILWSFPPNPQRDIKYFQIFRREAINQPFQLIKMYDFDDGNIKIGPNENLIDPALVEKVYRPDIGRTTPPTFFYDEEFTKESSYIYAICSVDAHGLTSNYSMQLHVKYDRITSQLTKQIVSIAGAPKPYPNALLNVDTFVDTIKDEGHGQVTVIFNPEYLKVVNNDQQDLGLLKTKPEDFYQLQLINVDLQSEQNLKIYLQDRRVGDMQRPGGSRNIPPSEKR